MHMWKDGNTIGKKSDFDQSEITKNKYAIGVCYMYSLKQHVNQFNMIVISILKFMQGSIEEIYYK